MMKISTDIAEKVVQYRKISGFTQEQIADKVGISRQRWILVEKGERDLATEELNILANAFGINVSDFFENIPDLEKFRQMYLAFLIYASNSHKNVPKTKLAKMLYLADFSNYFDKLESMSGYRYKRQQFGPVNDVFFYVTDYLVTEGKVRLQLLDGGAQMLSLNTREIDFNKLSADELARIKKIARIWKDKNTQEIVNFTHEQLPWKLCRDGEYIPYSLIIQEDPDHVIQPAT